MTRRRKTYRGRVVIRINDREVLTGEAFREDGSVRMGPDLVPPYLPDPEDQRVWLKTHSPLKTNKR